MNTTPDLDFSTSSVECLIFTNNLRNLRTDLETILNRSDIPAYNYSKYLNTLCHSVSIERKENGSDFLKHRNFVVGIISQQMYDYFQTCTEVNTDEGFNVDKKPITIRRFSTEGKDVTEGCTNQMVVHLSTDSDHEWYSFRVRGWIKNAVDKMLRRLCKLGYLSRMPSLHTRTNNGGEITGTILSIYFADEVPLSTRVMIMTMINNTPVFTPTDLQNESSNMPKRPFNLWVPNMRCNWMRAKTHSQSQ